MEESVSLFSVIAKDNDGAMVDLKAGSDKSLFVDQNASSDPCWVVTLTARVTPLAHQYFVADKEHCTVNGFFMDINGDLVGSPFVGLIPHDFVKDWIDVYGSALPDKAVGVIFDLSTDTKYLYASGDRAETKAYMLINKASLPTLAAKRNIILGAVAHHSI